MKQILVCEDEDAIRDFIVINLKRSGYNTVEQEYYFLLPWLVDTP